jgi:CO/xanthine dehydrogenase Mo-binding subunit
MGWGTYGSRTTAVGGAALVTAVRKIKEKAKALAAHMLEAAVEDIDYADGRFFVKGAPASAKTIQDIALHSNLAWNLPRHGSRPRGRLLLRPAQLHVSVRGARRGGGTRRRTGAVDGAEGTSRSTTADRRSTR